GAAFAAELARAGRDVVLVEREGGPHDKVCGEFLSGEALGYLAALGVDVGALGAVPVEIVRVSHGSVSAQRALPFRAASLSRRRRRGPARVGGSRPPAGPWRLVRAA
ncbi:FAD-dependent oxidoreductase, partial [Hansschlegelia beijingensis]